MTKYFIHTSNNTYENHYDKVCVTITKERTNTNTRYKLKEFSEVKLISIYRNERVSDITGHDYLILYIEDPGEENAKKAVETLKKNSIVKNAFLYGIDYED